MIDQLDRFLDQTFGKSARVGDGSRGQDKLRVGVVKLEDTFQAADDVSQMRAEHTAVNVNFVDHNVADILEYFSP